jgi:hypothetical protein
MCLTLHLFSGGAGFNIRPCEGHHNFVKDRQKPESKAGCTGKVGEQKLVQLDREAAKRRGRQARTKANARKKLMNFAAARYQCPYLSWQGRLSEGGGSDEILSSCSCHHMNAGSANPKFPLTRLGEKAGFQQVLYFVVVPSVKTLSTLSRMLGATYAPD